LRGLLDGPVLEDDDALDLVARPLPESTVATAPESRTSPVATSKWAGMPVVKRWTDAVVRPADDAVVGPVIPAVGNYAVPGQDALVGGLDVRMGPERRS